MDLGASENETSNPDIDDSSPAAQRRRDIVHNGTPSIFGETPSSDLDQPHVQVLHQQQRRRHQPGHSGGDQTTSDRFHDTSYSLFPGAMVLEKSKSKNSQSSMGAVRVVRYRECQKNHAASVGGNVLDGCGEFMPSGEGGSIEALKCAACDCHRNFHRKEVEGDAKFGTGPGGSSISNMLVANALHLPPPLPSPSMSHHHHHGRFSGGFPYSNNTLPAIVQPVNVAFGGSTMGGGAGTESSSEELNVFHSNAEAAVPPPPFPLGKKRFRTKFTHEQKARMLEFAEKLGWRIQKESEEQVDRFCAEIGVKRQVFKVWMHNNKNNSMKKHLEGSYMQSLDISDPRDQDQDQDQEGGEEDG